MPSLTVDDVQARIDFFAGLGFEVEDRWEDNGVLLGAMLKAGDARLGLSQDDGKKGRDRLRVPGARASRSPTNRTMPRGAPARSR